MPRAAAGAVGHLGSPLPVSPPSALPFIFVLPLLGLVPFFHPLLLLHVEQRASVSGGLPGFRKVCDSPSSVLLVSRFSLYRQ